MQRFMKKLTEEEKEAIARREKADHEAHMARREAFAEAKAAKKPRMNWFAVPKLLLMIMREVERYRGFIPAVNSLKKGPAGALFQHLEESTVRSWYEKRRTRSRSREARRTSPSCQLLLEHQALSPLLLREPRRLRAPQMRRRLRARRRRPRALRRALNTALGGREL